MPRNSAPYEAAGGVLLRESGCTVRWWREATSGAAFLRADDWGIVVPRPRGPVSFGVFAHEVGHQLLHRGRRRARWLEEVEAWEYALAQFERFGLEGVERCAAAAAERLVYAAAPANRRCSPETAQRILERFPAWVWRAGEQGCELTRDEVAAAAAR